MIIGNLKTIQEELSFYPQAIQKGLSWLLTQDLEALPVGGPYEIDGTDVFAKVSEYMTQDASLRQAERHEKYIDIQCVAAGSERIGIGRRETVGAITQNTMAEKDAEKYADMKDEIFVDLTAGTFALCFPWDVHRANCSPAAGDVHVKKVLVKVAVSALQK